jgi:hypothetical protein
MENPENAIQPPVYVQTFLKSLPATHKPPNLPIPTINIFLLVFWGPIILEGVIAQQAISVDKTENSN